MADELDIVALDTLNIRLSEAPHPFQAASAVEAAAYWQEVKTANPALYDGTVMLHSTMVVADGELDTLAHRVPFSTFLYWRDKGPFDGAFHLFGAPMILSSDGAMILIEMGPDTANAGRINCPSGSLDESDIVGDRLDIDGNMRREVLEETGLDLDEAAREDGYFVHETGGIFIVFRRYRFNEKATELVRRVEAHIADDPHPELSGVIAVWGLEDIKPAFHHYMPRLLAWHFNEAEDAGRRTGKRVGERA